MICLRAASHTLRISPEFFTWCMTLVMTSEDSSGKQPVVHPCRSDLVHPLAGRHRDGGPADRVL